MRRIALLSSSFLITTGIAGIDPALADNTAAGAADASSEQVIVTGTRDPRATARNSISPVLVITNAQLSATGQADIRDALP